MKPNEENRRTKFLDFRERITASHKQTIQNINDEILDHKNLRKWKKFSLPCEYFDEYCSSEWFNVFKDMKIHFNLFRIICMNWEKLTDKNVPIYFLMVRYNERNSVMMFVMFDILMNRFLHDLLHRAMYQNQHCNSIINNWTKSIRKKIDFFQKDFVLNKKNIQCCWHKKLFFGRAL